MKHLKYDYLRDFINQTDLPNVDEDTLFIFDIDGVFFRGIFDPREILGIISNETLLVFEQILKKKSACWIMTNRLHIFKYFPFIRQLKKTIQKITSVSPSIYSKCSAFLESGSNKYNIIMNARKPAEDSQEVVKRGMTEYKQVLYVGGRDTPFYFTDKELVEEVYKETSLNNITFIEIH